MISFIIPTLKEESIIEQTLLWLSAYTGEKEIIISDGKSSDRTLEIAKKYTDKVVVYEGAARQTIGMARNMGASLASGEYLVFLDADVTIFDPDVFFATAIRIMESTEDSVALTAFMRVLPEMETRADKFFFGVLNHTYRILNNRFHIGGASGEFQMVRSQAFQTVGGFNEILIGGEDHEHFNRLSKIGKTLFVEELTIYHTGRRPHKVGWPKLLLIWGATSLPMSIRKIFLKEWTVVR